MRKLLILISMLMALTLILAACGGDSDEPADSTDSSSQSTGDATAGETKFQQTCSACHGPDAKGLPNLGRDLTVSTFVIGQSDDDLIAFVKIGRSVSDPANETGVDMPPKGGNPALSDDDLYDIVAYLRTLEE